MEPSLLISKTSMSTESNMSAKLRSSKKINQYKIIDKICSKENLQFQRKARN